MSNETKIIKATGKCNPINNKNKNANCDCAIENFENNTNDTNNNTLFGVSYKNNIIIYLLKFALITFFIYLVFSTLQNKK